MKPASPHIVLCAATGRQGNAPFAIVFYTTSRLDFAGQQRPRQYLLVNETRAAELGQKTAFVVDASRIAHLPYLQLSPKLTSVAAAFKATRCC